MADDDSDGKGYHHATLDDFKMMTWKQRQDWIKAFAKNNGLSNWFDDMAGAIDFMTNDLSLAREEGTAEVMDAAVIQAINDGWLIYNGEDAIGGGGQGWANFFSANEKYEQKKITKDELIAIRLQAEQDGVDYSWSLSDVQEAYGNSTTLDQIYFDIFKGGADSYRSSAIDFRSNPLAVNRAETRQAGFLLAATDPRTSGPILNTIGRCGYPAALFLWSQSQPSLLYYP